MLSSKDTYRQLQRIAWVELLTQIIYFLKGQRILVILEDIGIKESGYVFINPKTGNPYVTLYKGLNGACRQAGIERVTFHNLRHTFATRLIDKKIDIVTVKELLGHSRIETTQRYTHTSLDKKRNALEVLNSNDE